MDVSQAADERFKHEVNQKLVELEFYFDILLRFRYLPNEIAIEYQWLLEH